VPTREQTTRPHSADSGIYTVIGIPSPDAIQKFKIQTSTYDSSYGSNPGATHGKHTIRAGFEHEWTRWNMVFAGLERGGLQFHSLLFGNLFRYRGEGSVKAERQRALAPRREP
jgi:hypothetical protein